MARSDAKKPTRVHLLDVGQDQYGDCVLCEVGGFSILIDGGHKADFDGSTGHPSIPLQLADLFGLKQGETIRVSLLIVSHAHDDHIGCLPQMVEEGLLEAEWALMVDPDLAWGRNGNDAHPSPTDRLAAVMREEPRDDLDDRLAFTAIATDLAGLQARYRKMIEKLRADGTHVVLHGKDRLAALQDQFASINLTVLGPPKKQLEACRDLIVSIGRDIKDAFDAVAGSDADIFAIYQKLRETLRDAPDAKKSAGPAINLQSSIVVFGDGEQKFLFTGDAQLEKPEVASKDVSDGVANTLAAIEKNGPYAFVKLGHHGSYNAFGETFLENIGKDSVNFGICTGSGSRHHPSAAALEILRENKSRLRWVRTDRNGRSTFEFGSEGPTVAVTRGKANDLTAPGDEAMSVVSPVPEPAPNPVVVVPTLAPAMPPASLAVPVIAASKNEPGPPIEIRIPFSPDVGLSIALKLDVLPMRQQPVASVLGSAASLPQGDLVVAGGRHLPALLFATCESALSRNVGTETAGRALAALRSAGHVVVSDLPDGRADSQPYADAIRKQLSAHREVAGVVLVGGLDVVPSQRRDVLPSVLRAQVSSDSDPDDFVVWSDAVYGDVDGDGLAELPVSRIPDGHSEKLLLKALQAAGPGALNQRNGVRNWQRPFADGIFEILRGSRMISQSHPLTAVAPSYRLDGDHIYLMLHGDWSDATRFWGETEDYEPLEAVNMSNLAVPAGTIVFTGCCWGALIVREPAYRVQTGTPVTPRRSEESLALKFLEQGALAFIGCTGVHYSPQLPPYDSLGGPMHKAFWTELFANGGLPAKALFDAKKRYLAGIPHVRKDPIVEAIERKIYEEYTCLGLGW